MSTINEVPLDPDAQVIADRLSTAVPARLSGLGVTGVRAFGKQCDANTPTPPEVDQVSEHDVPGLHGDVRVRLYRPDAQGRLPVLLFLHGEGWTFGSIDGGRDYLVRDIVRTVGIAVASVDYRLAPENKFPIPVEDSQAPLEWIRAEAENLGLDPSAFAVGGDSAGADIAAAITHLDRNAGNKLLAQTLLCQEPNTQWTGRRGSSTQTRRCSPRQTRCSSGTNIWTPSRTARIHVQPQPMPVHLPTCHPRWGWSQGMTRFAMMGSSTPRYSKVAEFRSTSGRISGDSTDRVDLDGWSCC